MAKNKANKTPESKAAMLSVNSLEVDQFQAEEDLRTLMKALEITADPQRHRAAQDLAREKKGVMEEIGTRDGGKARRDQEKLGGGLGDDMSIDSDMEFDDEELGGRI